MGAVLQSARRHGDHQYLPTLLIGDIGNQDWIHEANEAGKIARHIALFGSLPPELLDGTSQGLATDGRVLMQSMSDLLKLYLLQGNREVVEKREKPLVLWVGVLVQCELVGIVLGLA